MQESPSNSLLKAEQAGEKLPFVYRDTGRKNTKPIMETGRAPVKTPSNATLSSNQQKSGTLQSKTRIDTFRQGRSGKLQKIENEDESDVKDITEDEEDFEAPRASPAVQNVSYQRILSGEKEKEPAALNLDLNPGVEKPNFEIGKSNEDL